MKWPFSRKKDVSAVPLEIQEYYQTERRERTGIAWLLALGTLLITIGLAALLFFGGRWIYRTVVDNDDDNTQETAQTDQGQEGTTTPEGTPAEPTTPTESSTGTSSTSTSTPNNASSPTPSSAATPSTGTQGATTTPVTGDSDLPDTGPGDTLAVFVTVTAVSAIVYELRRRYFA